MSGTNGYTALSSATPLPGALASATFPAAYARISPGTPSTLSFRNTSGSRYASSVHPPGSLRGAQPDLVVVDVEVGSLHQLDAHLPGKEAVLEVRRVERPRGEQHDRGVPVRVGSDAAERVGKTGGVVIDALDPGH